MRDVEESSTSAAASDAGPEVPRGPGPEVTSVLEGATARITVAGELTDAARRPLVRTMTDLLLGTPDLHRVELHLAGVGFMNSAGMSVLVQLQRLGQPREVAIVLVDPPPAVIRPLQLSGLWHRFPIEERAGSAEPE
jgi:stage II sporulation protein AA (anti-sigma F factor antagonist)